MTTPVQGLRHDARAAAEDATRAINRPLEELETAYSDITEALLAPLREISNDLKGRSGISKEQQVARLNDALEKAEALRASAPKFFDTVADTIRSKTEEALESLPQTVAEAKAKAAEALDNLEASLSQAKELAETRDLDAHLAAKRAAREPEYDEASSYDG